MDAVHAWTWNVGMLHGPGVVRGLRSAKRLEGHWPHVIGLEEAGGTTPDLEKSLGHKYRVLSMRGWLEADNLVTLVRRDVPVSRWLTLRMGIAWVGPKLGRTHPGRTHHLIDLGQEWRFVHVQRVTGGPTGPNREAWQEEHLALQRVATRRRSLTRQFVIMGDQNNTRPESAHPLSSGGLADAIGGRVIWTGGKVDHAVVRDVEGKGQQIDHGQRDPEAHPIAAYVLHAGRPRRLLP